MLSINSIDSKATALRYYRGLRRSQRGLYIYDRVSNGLRTYITRDFLPSDDGRVDVQYVLSMIDYSHAFACMNMHAPDSNLLPRTLTNNDKADYVTITNGIKKEFSFYQREFIQAKFLDIFYPNNALNWKEKRNKLNSKVAGHIVNNETSEIIEIISKVYHQNIMDWCEEFMEEKLLVYRDDAEGETGCIKKLFTVNFNEVTKTFPLHVNKMSPQELENVETVADFKFTGEGKKLLIKYLQEGKQVEQEKYLLQHPEDERLFGKMKRTSLQMSLPAAFASSVTISCKKARHVPVTPADKDSSSEHDKLKFVTPKVKLEFSPQAHDAKAFQTPSQSKLDSAPRIPILSAACKAPSVSSSNGTIDLLDDKDISGSTLPLVPSGDSPKVNGTVDLLDDKDISGSTLPLIPSDDSPKMNGTIDLLDDKDISGSTLPLVRSGDSPKVNGTIDLLDDKDISGSTLPLTPSDDSPKAIVLDDSSDDDDVIVVEKKVNYESKHVHQAEDRLQIKKEAQIETDEQIKKEEGEKLEIIEMRVKEARARKEKLMADKKQAQEERNKKQNDAKNNSVNKKEIKMEKKEIAAKMKVVKALEELEKIEKARATKALEDKENKKVKKEAADCEMKEEEKVVEKEDEWNENDWEPMELGSQWDNYYKDLTCVKCNAKFEDAKKQAKGVVYFYGGAVGVQDGGMLCFICKEEIFANAGASRRSSRGGMKNTKKNSDKKKNE